MKSQNGNVLFLILIAVALFAALSYAVTSSSRTSGSDISPEKAELIASQLVQFSSAVSTAITRMTMSGISPDQLLFDCVGQPADGSPCLNPLNSWDDVPASDWKYEIFHPSGGGVSQVKMPIPQNNNNPYVMLAQIDGVGKTASDLTADKSGVDLVFGLVGVPDQVCKLINQKAGVTGIPLNSFDYAFDEKITYGFDSSGLGRLGDSSSPEFYGKPMGCNEINGYGGEKGFYSVVLVR